MVTAKTTVPFLGGCACDAIRYECSEQLVFMVNCHCRDCQKASGSAYSPTLIVEMSSLKLLKGEAKYHCVPAQSGNIARRGFCPDCGTPLFAGSSAKTEFLGIKASSLDDPSWFKPEANVWTCSVQPWDFLDPNVPSYHKYRPRPSDA